MKTKINAILSLMLIIALTAAAFVMTSCGKNENTPEVTGTEEKTVTITVTVVWADGSSTDYVITTVEKTLYGALDGEGLVGGEDGPYGFYLKEVNGIRADYDLDGAYWALYKNGEMMMTGMESENIADGGRYSIVYTK